MEVHILRFAQYQILKTLKFCARIFNFEDVMDFEVEKQFFPWTYYS